MSERLAFLDQGVAVQRGVITLDGRPERLLVWRDDDDPRLRLGARLTARVASVEPALATAFLDLGDGHQAILPFKSDAKPVRGEAVQIEIRTEPRRGKLAVARRLSGGDELTAGGEPAGDLAEVLKRLARTVSVVGGRAAREAADEAEATALDALHPLPGGGMLAIEPTRALTAIDVDLGERKGSDAKRVTRMANLAALQEGARLLRLKSIGGLVVVDLVGRGHDGAALLTAARSAFGPDNPGVAIGPVGRFGLMEISLPRRARPIADLLCDPDGALSARTLAERLLRRLQDEAAAQPGARLVGVAAPEVAQAAQRFAGALTGQIGARFAIEGRADLPRQVFQVHAR